MNSKYFMSLLGANAVLAALSIVALVLFVTHTWFRQTVGYDKASFDKFVAKVEGGHYTRAHNMLMLSSIL
jgi:hypothetical protein